MSGAVVAAFLEEWHHVVAVRDLTGLEQLLEDDVRLGAPPYWKKFDGRPTVHFLLSTILEIVEDFRYRREWVNEGELALEFLGHIGDLELQGVDLISLSERGRIAEIDVAMRPADTVQRLIEVVAPKMVAYLSRSAAQKAAREDPVKGTEGNEDEAPR